MRQNTKPAFPWIELVFAVLLAGVILVGAFFGYRVHQLTAEKKAHKLTHAFVNNVSFGLLSVDLWRDQVMATVRKELGEFRLTKAQENDLRKEINGQLHTLVNQAFADLEKPKKSIGDKLKKAAIKTLVEKEEVEKEIPGYSSRLMRVLTNPASYKRITNIADTTITRIGRKIYDSSAASTSSIMDSIYHKYGAIDRASFEAGNAGITTALRNLTYRYVYGMIAIAAFIFGVWIIFHRKRNLQPVFYIAGAVASLLLLWIGISTPIIEIDATLAKMDIQFLSGSLSFRSQNLFFQSQSLIDVVSLLLGSGRIASIVVGIMIIVFCVVFPVIVLVAMGMAVISPRKFAQKPAVDYLAFHASKWNMSDVMALAILMTYIGFNGIVDSTLLALNYTEGSITSVTSNNTAIEPGYMVYLGFVVFSITLHIVLKRIRKNHWSTMETTNEPQ